MLINLGKHFLEKHQTGKAVGNLEKALKLARAVNNGTPTTKLAEILCNLAAVRVTNGGKSDESLSYLVEAKEIMDKLLGPNNSHPLTPGILYNMGVCYHMLGNLPKAFRCCNDALNINCELYGENSSCGNMEDVLTILAKTLKKMGSYIEAKENYTKAIGIAKKNPLTKSNCCNVIGNLYELASTYSILKQQNETLMHLEEARKIAKDTGFKDWTVVCVLVQLIRKYARMGSILKSIICYKEAREIAKSLPKEQPLAQLVLEMLKLMKI